MPHNAPVQSEMNANNAPVGAMALAIIEDKRVLKISPSAAYPAMIMYKNMDNIDAGT